jgi:hypothetical protein
MTSGSTLWLSWENSEQWSFYLRGTDFLEFITPQDLVRGERFEIVWSNWCRRQGTELEQEYWTAMFDSSLVVSYGTDLLELLQLTGLDGCFEVLCLVRHS